MNVVVTGGAGFIGGHLVDRLIRDDHYVTVVDDLSVGVQANVPQGAELVVLDLGKAKLDELATKLGDSDPDWIVHLAGIHYIPFCDSHPDEVFLANVKSTELISRLATNAKTCRRLVCASTMAVYGPHERTHSEEDPPEPQDTYGVSKALLEFTASLAVRRSSHLSGACLRLANVYGSRETNPHLIPAALDRLQDRSNGAILMGNLEPKRDFIHVLDVVEAIMCVLEEQTDGYREFNVGTGIATPARRVVELLANAVGDSRPILEDPSRRRQTDRKTLTPDIARIKKETSWRPTIQLEQGLAQLAQESAAEWAD